MTGERTTRGERRSARDIERDIVRDVTRDFERDAARDLGRNAAGDIDANTAENLSKAAEKNPGRNAAGDIGKAAEKNPGKNAAGDMGKAAAENYATNASSLRGGRSRKKKKHPVLIVLGILLLGGVIWFVRQWNKGADPVAATAHKEQPGYYTVAVFGVDSRSGTVGKEALSDVNIIARIDMKTGEIRLVSLYRDTYAQIDEEGKFHKLNEAYFRGGPDAAVRAVEMNTDVGIDDYAAFNWKAIVDAINILGGIDLEITDAEFKYINAFITETVNVTGVGSYQLEHAGQNHLDGVQAVAYARLRLMDTDFNRTERQRKVVRLAFEKAKEADFLKLNNILVTVMPQISTSVSMADLIPFARNISYFHLGEAAGFPFEKQLKNVGKLDCVIPVTLESNVRALHEFLYPDKEYTPSKRLQAINERIIADTGLGGSGEAAAIKTDGQGNGGSGSGSGGKDSGGGQGAQENDNGRQAPIATPSDFPAEVTADTGTQASSAVESAAAAEQSGAETSASAEDSAAAGTSPGEIESFDDVPLPF